MFVGTEAKIASFWTKIIPPSGPRQFDRGSGRRRLQPGPSMTESYLAHQELDPLFTPEGPPPGRPEGSARGSEGRAVVARGRGAGARRASSAE
ncbi:hypothetical protein ACHAWF_009812 [Thalassiosira exigua]